MGIPSESNRIHNLAWAVLANNVATGKAEVVKVTNQDDRFLDSVESGYEIDLLPS